MYHSAVFLHHNLTTQGTHWWRGELAVGIDDRIVEVLPHLLEHILPHLQRDKQRTAMNGHAVQADVIGANADRHVTHSLRQIVQQESRVLVLQSAMNTSDGYV